MENMTLPALVVLLLTFGAVITDGGLLELARMIQQITGKSAIPYYHAYGCYCGLGGKGRPLDDTDWCCHHLDCCYHRLVKQGCSPKTTGYSYGYHARDVYCGAGTQCQRQICECDRNLVMCLKKHAGSYKTSYRYYWNILCRGSAPGCQPKGDSPVRRASLQGQDHPLPLK